MTEIWLAVFTNAIVILGWIVVFRQAIHLRKREDIRATVELSSKTIDEIYSLCQTYYGGGAPDHIGYISGNIKAKFVLLSHYMILLRDAGISTGASAALTKFKMHATGGYFETTRYREQEDVPNWKVSLAASAHELKFRIEKGYFDWSKASSKLSASLIPST